MHKILTLNNIALAGLRRFPRERYEVASELTNPDGIILRSFNMHDMEVPTSVAAIGRAGAGVNNIPIAAMSQRGVPVFNAPGANANAVKELAVAGLLIAVRNLCDARDYVRNLALEGDALNKAVEAGKKQYVGFELPGRTLGVIGLGAIGVQVANVALSLGMKVVGFDPNITVQSAWKLSSGVQKVETLDDLFRKSDAVTVHVPLIDATKGLVNRDRLALMKPEGIVVNFARGGIVDNAAILEALDDDRLHAYVCDFPTEELIKNPKVLALPHLGASTHEAEENCAVMVAENVKEYLENGNVRYSVNFPETVMPRTDAYRLAVSNANVPNMVVQISSALAAAELNIEDLLNKSRGDLAYTVVDLDGPVTDETIAEIRGIEGVLAVRYLGKPLT
ncbi:MAG: phosphoglycerate dehydrogenase [Pseudomonadota bacterium]